MIPAQTWEHCSFDSVELSSSVCLLVPCKGWRETEQGKQRRSAPALALPAGEEERLAPHCALRGKKSHRSSGIFIYFFFSQYIVRRLCYLELLFVAPRAAV